MVLRTLGLRKLGLLTLGLRKLGLRTLGLRTSLLFYIIIKTKIFLIYKNLR
jgi:hypothetical protein